MAVEQTPRGWSRQNLGAKFPARKAAAVTDLSRAEGGNKGILELPPLCTAKLMIRLTNRSCRYLAGIVRNEDALYAL
jgi:hypothetical protein